MSKRRSDTQLTKDDYEAQVNGSFNFSANNEPENERDTIDPTKMADPKIMSGRKIAPLKKGRGGRGGAAGGSARGGGSNIPNFFATTPTGGFGANGTSQPDGGMGGGFTGFGTSNAAPTAPSFGGNATGGGFGFGGNNNAPEQPKVNPFGSLAPATSSTTNGGGMFGGSQLGGGGLFGGSAPQNASTGGMFGNNNNNGTASPAPASGGFTFGGSNNNTAPAQPTQPAATGFSKAPFSFGGNTASPMFGGDNKPAGSSSFTFGANNASTPAVTPPATSSFTFGGSTTATAPAVGTGSYFGAPNPAPEKTPEPQPVPAVGAPTPSFTFGSSTPTQPPPAGSLFGKPSDSQGSLLFGKPGESQGSSLFGKPVESQSSNLFGRPSPSPEPTSSNLFTPSKPKHTPEPTANGLFGSSAPAPAATSFFGQPKEQEQSKSLFGGFGNNESATPKQEPPKSLFGGFGDSKPEAPKQPFFGGFGTPAEKKEEPSKPLFGFGPVTEKKQESVNETPFSFGTPSTPTFQKKDDDAMDENVSPPKSPSVFEQPADNTSSFSGFGTTKFAAAPNQFTTPPMFAPITTNSATTTTNVRTPSPPLPSDATSWTIAQLNEYYNLFALRALNYSFLEGLKKADQMGDWSVSCEIYIRESERIKECQQNGERYKGASVEPKSGSGVSGKRNNNCYDDNEVQGGGGKRSKGNGEDLKTSGSDSSKALASIIGGSTTSGADIYKLANKPTHGFAPPTTSSSFASGPKLASAPLFGFNPPNTATEKKVEEKKGGSIFDSPNSPANNGGFVNPFQSHTPDPSEKDHGDEDDDESSSAPSAAGSLFGRVTEPKKEPVSSGSIFSNSTKSSSSGLFSSKLDQTWSPDKGVKFETNGTNGSLFSSKTDAPKGLFGSGSVTSSAATTPGVSGTSSLFGTPGVKSEVGFSFGGNGTTKPSGPISIPESNASAGNDNSSEPNDNAHLAKNDVDLSAQGPGEEDEDSQFQVRAIIYEVVTGGEPKKAGVGTLRVLKNRITGKARVITRTEGGKVVLNVGLVKEITYGLGNKGGKIVSIVEFLPEGGNKRYSVRVKEEEDAKKLGEIMDVAKMS